MSIYIYDTNTISPISASGSDDTHIIAEGVYVTTSGSAIGSGGSNTGNTFLIDGTVITEATSYGAYGMYLSAKDGTEDNFHTVIISETGKLIADQGSIYVARDHINLTNYGLIESTRANSTAIWFEEDDQLIDNYGTITSALHAISSTTGGDVVLNNFGTINGKDGYGISLKGATGNNQIFNMGIIQAGSDGVRFESDDNVFLNTGSVISDGGSVVALGDGARIENSGQISSDSLGITIYGAGASISNSGLISTTVTGIRAREGDNHFISNSGKIDSGDVGISVYNSDFSAVLNSGDILARSVGIDVDGYRHRVTNSGDISVRDTGVELHGDLVRFTNTGTILAGDVYGIGVNSKSFASDTIRVFNSGEISGGSYSIRGGSGTDIIVNDGILEGDVYLWGGDDIFRSDGGIVYGIIHGGDGDDTITGGALADTIDGGTGKNEIRSRGGDDMITTGDDVDFINAGAGDDEIISGHGDDTVRGSDGDDDINGQGGVDFIQGGNGNDYIRMGNGDGQRGEGNAGDDTLVGGNQKDILLGGADEDELFGKAGDDVLRGGTGDDVLIGGDGDDRLIGNAGDDTAVFTGNSSDYTFTSNGNGTVDVFDTVGSDGTDNLFGVEMVEFTDGTYLLADLI